MLVQTETMNILASLKLSQVFLVFITTFVLKTKNISCGICLDFCKKMRDLHITRFYKMSPGILSKANFHRQCTIKMENTVSANALFLQTS